MGQTQHKAEPGDLIEFKRPLYLHWAVYVGDDDVVHLTTGKKSSSSSGSLFSFNSSGGEAVVKHENIWKVAGRCEFKVNNILDDYFKPRDPDVIVEEACEMVGKRLPYSVTKANCEHFVTELRYGEPLSIQGAIAEIAVLPFKAAIPGLWG